MIINSQQDFEGSVPTERIGFKFEANAMMVSILSSLIYKNKILAVIRELSCNAYDAHVAAKNPKPFRVQVPTKLEPVFAVEDEGVGLDAASIGDIFWTYGRSTKTKTNDQIGAMGIGSKSPFAYTKSSFVVRSRFNGTETSYLCFINEAGTPDGAVTNTCATTEPNGVRVELGVRGEDIAAFQKQIKSFFSFWKVKPELINGGGIKWAEHKPTLEGKGWYVASSIDASADEDSEHSQFGQAIMGNIAYPISLSAIPSPSTEMQFVARHAFVIDFPMASLAFAASREELSYDDRTVKALEARAKQVMAEFYDMLIESTKKFKGTPMDVLTKFQTYVNNISSKYSSTVVERSKLKTLTMTADNGFVLSPKMLNDTREFTLKATKHTPMLMYHLIDVRSSNNVRLKQAREIRLEKQEPELNAKKEPILKDGVPSFKTRTRSCTWFHPDVKAKVTKHGGEITDYLHQGFTVAETSMSVSVPRYHSIPDVDADTHKVLFVLNDVGARGSLAVRNHYATNRAARANRDRVIFVDHDSKKMPVDFGEAEVLELVKGTLAEGATIVKLSALEGFMMPAATPSVPRSSTPSGPRGFFEVRRVTFRPTSKDTIYNAKAGNARYDFAPLNEVESEYVKVDPKTLTSVYTLSAPGGMEKSLRDKLRTRIVTYALHAGIFDKFVKKDADGNRELELIVRNADDIASLISKGAQLTALEDFLALADAPDVSSVADQVSLSNQLNEYNSVPYKMTQSGILTTGMRKALGAKLSPTSLVAKTLTMINTLDKFFAGNKERVALAALASDLDSGPDIFDEISKRYPLVIALTTSTVIELDVMVDSIVAYIEMEDKRAADAKAVAAAVALAKAATAATVKTLATV
jgi:hypothetical protein